MTKKIDVQMVEEHALTLREFLLTGDSFGICRDLHRWPPLPTLVAFLACGVDDVGERTMHWQPFARPRMSTMSPVRPLTSTASSTRSELRAMTGSCGSRSRLRSCMPENELVALLPSVT